MTSLSSNAGALIPVINESPENIWLFFNKMMHLTYSYYGYYDVAKQMKNIIRLGERSPTFRQQFIEIYRRLGIEASKQNLATVATDSTTSTSILNHMRQLCTSDDVHRLISLEKGNRFFVQIARRMNQGLLKPIGDAVRYGLSYIGNTRIVAASRQAVLQIASTVVRAVRPIVVATGTAVGGVVTVIFAVPELTIAAGILLLVVVVGSVIYLIRSN